MTGAPPHPDDRVDEGRIATALQLVRGTSAPSANARSKSAHVCIIRLRAMMLRFRYDGHRQVGQAAGDAVNDLHQRRRRERILDHDLVVGGVGQRLGGEARVPRRVAELGQVLGEWSTPGRRSSRATPSSPRSRRTIRSSSRSDRRAVFLRRWRAPGRSWCRSGSRPRRCCPWPAASLTCLFDTANTPCSAYRRSAAFRNCLACVLLARSARTAPGSWSQI